MQERPAVELVLDGGGPIAIWKEETPGSLHRRLLIRTYVCTSPACDCRDVMVDGVVVDDRYEGIQFTSNQLSYSFRRREGDPVDRPPLRRLSATVDVDSGEVNFNSSALMERRDEELLGWLKKGMDDYQLNRLRKRWRFAKGVDQDRWKRMDWRWWEPGDMVSWCEVFPDDSNILFPLKKDVFWADDMYCISPDCSCREAGIHFSRVTSNGLENFGAVSVTLPKGKFAGLMGEGGNEKMLGSLWKQVRKEAGLLSLLNERMQRIKPIGREIARLSGHAGKVIPPPLSRSPGRNEPCSCGSGKKFKRCCGR